MDDFKDEFNLLKVFINEKIDFTVDNNLYEVVNEGRTGEELLIKFIAAKTKSRERCYEFIRALEYQKEVFEALKEFTQCLENTAKDK